MFALGTLLLFYSGQMPVAILSFGAVDLIGALWTASTLHRR